MYLELKFLIVFTLQQFVFKFELSPLHLNHTSSYMKRFT